ncbi:MAG: hypothetical protein DRJ34_04030, partial [Thermoprotei archaeon]
MRHFKKALEKIRPSITSDMIKYYKEWGERIKLVQSKKILTPFYT